MRGWKPARLISLEPQARPCGNGQTQRGGQAASRGGDPRKSWFESAYRRCGAPAGAGWVLVLAVDALSPVGVKARQYGCCTSQMIARLDLNETRGHYLAAVQFLKAYADSTGKVGCVGFCWGSMANQLAVNSPDLLAAVAYYGGQAAVADVPKIKGEFAAALCRAR